MAEPRSLLLGRIYRKAPVGDGAPGAHAAGEQATLPKPRMGLEVDTVVDLGLLPVVRRLGDQVVDGTERRGFDVVEAAELVPATAG